MSDMCHNFALYWEQKKKQPKKQKNWAGHTIFFDAYQLLLRQEIHCAPMKASVLQNISFHIGCVLENLFNLPQIWQVGLLYFITADRLKQKYVWKKPPNTFDGDAAHYF